MDPISARSNQPGVFSYGDVRESVDHGVTKGSEPFSVKPYDYTDQRIVTVGYEDKALTRKGNRHDPLQYGRSIYKVTNDEPFTLHSESVFAHNGEVQYRYDTKDYVSRSHSAFSFAPFTDGLSEDNAESEAITKALNNLGDSKAQLGADLAEARRTVDMLAKSAITGAKFLLALKRGQFGAAASAIGVNPASFSQSRGRNAANAWLQYNYGWKPLASTISSLTDLANEKMSASHLVKGTGYSNSSNSGDSSDFDSHITWSNELRHKAVLIGKVRSESLYNLSRIGVVNPASIAWEIVPWSFAIDWFMPVGQTLEAATATTGLDFVRGWQSKKMDYELHISKKLRDRYMDSYGTTYVRVMSPGSYAERGHRFFRSPFGSFPRARFFADITPFSVPRALNAIALIRQLLR